VEEMDLVFDRGIGNGGRLKPVSKRFVIEQNPFAGQRFRLADQVPVID
jgi:hypothetical protein